MKTEDLNLDTVYAGGRAKQKRRKILWFQSEEGKASRFTKYIVPGENNKVYSCQTDSFRRWAKERVA